MEQMKAQTKSKSKPRPVSEARKIRKPLMERKRRERINTSLSELARLLTLAKKVKADGVKPNKLEKADILELTVNHLQNLQNVRNSPQSTEDVAISEERYQQGFSECIKVVERALRKSTSDTLKEKLLCHLNARLKSLSDRKKSKSSSDENTPPATMIQTSNVKIPLQASSKINSDATSLTLVPTELPDGGMVFVLKGDPQQIFKEWNQTAVESKLSSITDRSCQPPEPKKLRELKIKDLSVAMKPENKSLPSKPITSCLSSVESISHNDIDSTVCSLVSYDHQQTKPLHFKNILINNETPKQSPDLDPTIDQSGSSTSSSFSSDSYYDSNGSPSSLPMSPPETENLSSVDQQQEAIRSFPNAYSSVNASISDHYALSRSSNDNVSVIPSFSHNVMRVNESTTMHNQILEPNYYHENCPSSSSSERSQRCNVNNKSNCPPTPPPSPPTENQKSPIQHLDLNGHNMDQPFDLSLNKMWRPW